MKLPNLTILREFVDIPKVFHSSETDKPFSHCVSCERFLLADNEQYVIEKAIKNYQKFNTSDTIFEYAMCMECYERIQKSLSDTSKQNIENYFNQNVDLVSRRDALVREGDLRAENWISSCVVKGTPVRDLNEYQVVCQCVGDKMLFTYLPFMIGGDAMDEVVQLLSNKTIGEIDGLYGDFFGLSPELSDLVNDPRFVIV
jgi:hypothetical protein